MDAMSSALNDEGSIQATERLNETTTIIPTATRPFTYNSGHGDFSFLRLVDSYPKPPVGAGSSDFIREGVFPLMRLPKEIRFEIYKLVLAPLLSKHGFIPDGRRHLILKIEPFVDHYYQHMLAELRYILRRRHIDPELKLTYREEEKEVIALCKRFLYPASTRNYEITFPRFYTGSTPDMDGRDRWHFEEIQPALLASIRNLSNVSCQIRQELGVCAWTGSFLIIENGAFTEALSCLKERPAIYEGLKTLSLTIQWIWDTDVCDDRCPSRAFSHSHTCSIAFMSLIEFMNQHLDLDKILIRLEIPIGNAKKLLNVSNKPQWVGALQGLKCSRSFALLLRSKYNTTQYAWNDPVNKDIKAELKEFLTPLALTQADITEGPDLEWQQEDEYDNVGFHHRTQADGRLLITPSTYTEKHNFQFEKHGSFSGYQKFYIRSS